MNNKRHNTDNEPLGVEDARADYQASVVGSARLPPGYKLNGGRGNTGGLGTRTTRAFVRLYYKGLNTNPAHLGLGVQDGDTVARPRPLDLEAETDRIVELVKHQNDY